MALNHCRGLFDSDCFSVSMLFAIMVYPILDVTLINSFFLINNVPKKSLIMVVDDEGHILDLVSSILEVEGFNVVRVSDGYQCLQELQKNKPDLILLDMMMPGMSGREVCEKIRLDPKLKGLKIAFLTVANFSEIGRNVLKTLGIVDYITKPFNNKDLVKRVKKALADE